MYELFYYFVKNGEEGMGLQLEYSSFEPFL